jgi:uncharacterized phiE125 gp8 family phage protein
LELIVAGITIVTEPSRKALDIEDVKNFLKLDEDSDEVFVRTLIGAAEKYVEEFTGRSLINRTLKLSLDGIQEVDLPLWEGVRLGPDITFRHTILQLPYSPVSSVTSIYTYDDAGTATEFDSDKYYVDTASNPSRVVLKNGETWPSALRVGNAVEITYVAGYGASPANIPEPIRLALYQFIAFNYEHRGESEGAPVMLPSSIDDLLHPYRVMGFTNDPFRGKDRS